MCLHTFKKKKKSESLLSVPIFANVMAADDRKMEEGL